MVVYVEVLIWEELVSPLSKIPPMHSRKTLKTTNISLRIVEKPVEY